GDRTDFAVTPVASSLVLCYITDRSQFAGDRTTQEARLLEKIAECSAAGVDYIQLREKDLSGRDLEGLAHRASSALSRGSKTRLLINSRVDVALACGAHGVHLPAHNVSASEVRAVFNQARTASPIISVACHSIEDVVQAESDGADFVVFGPVFEKAGQPRSEGVQRLSSACHRKPVHGVAIPVLALGGVALENAGQCVRAGAKGTAAIRLFQQNNAFDVVQKLKSTG
ncbi:MAG TPA: thiamine phosphate synthase, partial [Candidatus Angelobacter sp.]|nr:thiamine phosphate synthase [Candidatus Angelobacter sp.]